MKAGWKTVKLAEVAEMRPPKSEVKRKGLKPADEVGFLPMEDLTQFQKQAKVLKTRTLSAVSNSYTYFANGDVLMAKISPCFQNGKMGIATGLPNGVGYGSSEYFVFRPSKELSAEWLFYYLQDPAFRRHATGKFSGTVGQQRLPKELIEDLEIPLPPLAEQKRIVALLDEAFAGIDEARAKADANLDNTNALFKSHVQAIFDQGAVGWRRATLEEISTNLDSKRVPITKNIRTSGEFPYYGASGIVDYVGDYIFEGDNLLVSEDGANLLARSTPIAFSVTGKYWVNNHAHILHFENMATQRFTEFYIESIKLDGFITGAAQPKLTQKSLNSIPIPIPESIQEQGAIVRSIESLQQGTEALYRFYEKKIIAMKELKSSLLSKAFAGELTS